MRIASCLTFALLAFTLTATTAAAYEGGVIIPQADPHLEDGYIDVYYHECDVIGSQPCEHHAVTTVYIPCVDPSVSQQPNAVVVQNCDQSYPVPVCVDPVAEPDLSGPYYGGTYGNCSTTVPVQTPCIDPDAGVRESWTWYGQVTEAYVRNCTTEVEAPVCNNIVTFWSLDEFRTHNPTTCRETSCTTYGVTPASDNRFTVYAGDCDDPTEVTTHCVKPTAVPDTTGPNYGVTIGNCGTTVPVQTPCVDPVAEPDLTGPYYGGTYGNCSTTVPVQTPCIDPDAGVRESWTWYGQVTEAYVRNCTTEVEVPVCNNIVTFWSLDEFRTHNPTTCRETSCTTYGLKSAGSGRFTVYAGDCDDPAEVTTPCANTDGTDVGPEGDGVRATVVVCGNTLVDRTVTPPPVTAPCGTAGSGGGNTVYVRVYPTCDWSDPANPRPTSAPIEREFQVGP